MAIKIRKDGQVYDLVLQANEIQVLDKNNHFAGNNVESVLNELWSMGGTGGGGGVAKIDGDEYIFVSDTEPEYDGIWLDTSDDSTSVEDSTIITYIRNYIDTNIKKVVDANTVKVDEIKEKVGDKLDVVSQLSGTNLLINGDFQVWSKGTSFVTNSSYMYSADRWRVSGFLTVDKSDNGIKITQTSDDTGEQMITQYIKESSSLHGKTLTLSFDVVGSTNVTGLSTRICDKNVKVIDENAYNVETTTKKIIHTFVIPSTLTNELQVDILFSYGQKIPSGQYIYIKNVKLEYGSMATPFVPKTYVQELQDCLMYDDDKLTTPYSNPNLFINGDFQVKNHTRLFGIDTDYACTGMAKYVVDRWLVASEQNTPCYARPASDGSGYLDIVFTDKTVNTSNFRYYIDINDLKKLVGQTLTLTIEYKSEFNDTWVSNALNCFSVPSNSVVIETLYVKKEPTTDGFVKKVATFKIKSVDNTTTSFHIQVLRGTNQSLFGYHRIKYCKLEQGLTSTPFVSRDYGEELAMCQRYYQRYYRSATFSQSKFIEGTLGDNNNGTKLSFNFRIPEMRVAPTVRLIGSPLQLRTFGGNGAVDTQPSWAVESIAYNIFTVVATGSGYDTTKPYRAGTWNANQAWYIECDSEIY